MNKQTNIDQSFVKALREALGLKINLIRNRQKISKKELAEMVGLTPATIAKIEAGKFSSEIDVYIKIGIALNFKVDLLC